MITLQNGVDSVERLAPILGDARHDRRCDIYRDKIARPGVIRHTGPMAKVRCGRLDGRSDPVLAKHVDADQSGEYRHHPR